MSAFSLIVAAWVALASVVLALAIYRHMVARREDDFLHVRESEDNLVVAQGTIAHKLEVIDRWGKLLTVVALVWGLALGGYYVYLSWLALNARSVEVPILR
jgi:hypothetical protein